MKLPVMLRSVHEKEVCELKKDIKFLEVKKEELGRKLDQEKADKNSTRALLTGSLKMANARNAELEEEIVEKNRQLTRVTEQYKSRNDELLEAQNRIEELEKELIAREWCIKERDKELEETRKINGRLLGKVTLAKEMQRQIKDKIDAAIMIEHIDKEITPNGAKKKITKKEVQKFMYIDDVIEVCMKLGLMV